MRRNHFDTTDDSRIHAINTTYFGDDSWGYVQALMFALVLISRLRVRAFGLFRCVVPEAALSLKFKHFPIIPNCQRANDVHIIKSL